MTPPRPAGRRLPPASLWIYCAFFARAAHALNVTPPAAPWDVSTLLTIDATIALDADVRCVFDGGATSDACVPDVEVPSRCTCRAPTSLSLLGDAPFQLEHDNGTVIENGVLTYYDAELPPELLSFSPADADCGSGLAVLSVRARNAAPTDALACHFGALGSSAGAFEAATRAAPNATEARVRCQVPASALLGDVWLRLTNDNGTRTSAPAPLPLTCYDSSLPPSLLSVSPEPIDISAIRNGSLRELRVRAGNMRRAAGALGCRYRGVADDRAIVYVNGTLLNTTLAPINETVGIATCPMPEAADAPGASGGALRLMGADQHADGASVVYGPPTDAPFGEMGPGGGGLVVRLRSHVHARVELSLDGVDLASARAPGELYGHSYTPLRVRVAGGKAHVHYGGVALLSDVALLGWDPDATWRVGVGARQGHQSAQHRVRSLRLRSALRLAQSSSVTVEVSLNGGADVSSGGPELNCTVMCGRSVVCYRMVWYGMVWVIIEPENSLGQRRACSRITEAWRCHRHSVKSGDGRRWLIRASATSWICMEERVTADPQLSTAAVDDIALFDHSRPFDRRVDASAQISLRLERGDLARELMAQRRVEVERIREERHVSVALRDANLRVRHPTHAHSVILERWPEDVLHRDVVERVRRRQQQERLEELGIAVETCA